MVRKESYSCIKHLDTDTWLHLEKCRFSVYIVTVEKVANNEVCHTLLCVFLSFSSLCMRSTFIAAEPYVNEESSENHETGEMETARLFRVSILN